MTAQSQRAKRSRLTVPRPSTVPSFLALCKKYRVITPVPEWKFHPERKWRIDFGWPLNGLGLEVDGSVWTQGRHTRGSGWMKDTEKLNAAAIAGIRMLRCTPQQLCTVEMMMTIRQALGASGTLRGGK